MTDPREPDLPQPTDADDVVVVGESDGGDEGGGMRRLLGVCVTAVVAWWLFADTYARHAASPGDTSTIRFSHFGDYEDYAMWHEIIAMFERRHPDLHVRQEYVVGFANRYTMKLRQQILTGTLPDVALIQYAPFHELAEHFADVTDWIGRSAPPKHATSALWPRHDLLEHSPIWYAEPRALARAEVEHERQWPCRNDRNAKKKNALAIGRTSDTGNPRGLKLAARCRRGEVNLDPTALASFQSLDGRQRGLPVSGGNLLIYGNVECFERAESFLGRAIPLPSAEWTMDDFRRTAELLTCDFDGDDQFDQFGFWLPRWVYYLPLLWSQGAQLCDESSDRWLLRGPAAERAFAFYRDLAVGRRGDRRVCPKPEEVPQLFQDVGFLTGKVGMCINGPWFQPFLDATRLADKYVVLPIPIGPAGRVTRITWDGLVVAPNLPPARAKGARQFVRFVLSKPVQQHIAQRGRALPARTDALDAFVDPPGNPVRQPFIDALAYSRLQPTMAAFGKVDRAINRRLARLTDPDETVSIPDLLADLPKDPSISGACVKRDEVR